MKKVLFIVDHKHRDLAASSLIGYYLKEDGYSVAYCATWHESSIVKEFSPDIIVLPKPIYKNHIFAGWKIRGIKIAVNDVEGNLQQKEFGFLKPKIFPDLYFYWNKIFYERQGEFFKNEQSGYTGRPPKMVLAGCPRIDFLHPKFHLVNKPKKELVKELDVPKNKKIITIATAGSSADLSDEDLKKVQINLNSRNSNPPDAFLEASVYRELREITVSIIKETSKTLPDYHIVLKPHPNEVPTFWESLVKDYKLKNITIMKSGTINDLLNLSDLHMAHNVCTSTFEAMIKRVPAIEIQTNRSSELFSQKDLNLPLFPILSVEQALEAIKKIESSREEVIEEGFKIAEDFCMNWYGKFDGQRCKEYAENIKELHDHKIEINHLSKIKIYFKFIVGHHISRFVKKVKRITPKKIIEKLAGKRERDWTDERHDKTIKPGDEISWFKKFNKILNE